MDRPMRTVLLSAGAFLLLAMPFALTSAEAPAPETGGPKESDFLSRIRRLTVEGRRAGEGYFSPDGSKMVFQSEREPGNPFFQIYEIDLATGDSRRISPGTGKTTCAFFRPKTGEVLFASTHHDPRSAEHQKAEIEARAAGKERRYGWDYDPEMDLYVADRDGRLTRLTETRGYDAEAAYSPDGEWIVFASNREAYARPLSPEEGKILETDPAHFADISIMRANGSDVRRLTEVPGYDGGPFFFPDGSRIIFRRFEAGRPLADIWSMRTDGSDARRLTTFGAMSWAPYVHPSGKYVFFASNKLGFSNFEIFIVDVEGTREPVRVTFTDGFDGLPVPSPDGRRLSWTSTRSGEGGEGHRGQIYLAEWNHERALAALEKAGPRQAAAPAAEPQK
jgi:Tol biopolymer transport system component